MFWEGQVLFYCDEFWNCIKRLQISAYLLCHIASVDSKIENTDRGGDYNNQKGFIDKDNGYGQRRLAYLHSDGREQKNKFIKNHPERKDSNRSISGVGRCRELPSVVRILACLFLFFLCAFTAYSVLFHKILEAERGRSFLWILSITFCWIHMRDSQEWVEEKCRLFIFTEMKTSGLILWPIQMNSIYKCFWKNNHIAPKIEVRQMVGAFLSVLNWF